MYKVMREINISDDQLLIKQRRFLGVYSNETVEVMKRVAGDFGVDVSVLKEEGEEYAEPAAGPARVSIGSKLIELHLPVENYDFSEFGVAYRSELDRIAQDRS